MNFRQQILTSKQQNKKNACCHLKCLGFTPCARIHPSGLTWNCLPHSGGTEGAAGKQNEPDGAVITVIGKDVYAHSYSKKMGEEL